LQIKSSQNNKEIFNQLIKLINSFIDILEKQKSLKSTISTALPPIIIKQNVESNSTSNDIFTKIIDPINNLIRHISATRTTSTTGTSETNIFTYLANPVNDLILNITQKSSPHASSLVSSTAPLSIDTNIFILLTNPINELINKLSPPMINVDDIETEFEKIKDEIHLETTIKNDIETKIKEMIDTDTKLNNVFKELSSDDLGLESSLTMSIINLGDNLLKLQKSMIQDTFNELKKTAKNKKLQERIANIFNTLSDKTDKMNKILINKQKQYKMLIV
jgi:hypothetical protein